MRKYNIPIFVPHKGCPFDCVFCNQKRITGSIKDVKPDDVTNTIEEYLKTLPKTDRRVEVAFFGGSFTGIPVVEQNSLMDRVKPYIQSGEIDGIRLSTRPDYISREILDNLTAHGVTTIELGVQSLNDDVLNASYRGHTQNDVIKAVGLIREYEFALGIQMMTGLPGDNNFSAIETADKIIRLKPDFVRIYPTLTIKDTYLEKMYKSGKYVPQTLTEAVELCKILLLKFEENGIDVIRVGLQPTEEINDGAAVVAGPFHSSFRELVETSIYYDLLKSKIPDDSREIIFEVNPTELSKAIGNNKSNIKKIKEDIGVTIKIQGNSELRKREVRLVAFKKT